MPSLNWKLVPKNIVMMDSCTHRTIFLCYSWCKSRTVQRIHIVFHRFLLSANNLTLFTRYFLPYRARIFNNHMCSMCECFSRVSKLCLTEGMLIRTQMGLCDNPTLGLSFIILHIVDVQMILKSMFTYGYSLVFCKRICVLCSRWMEDHYADSIFNPNVIIINGSKCLKGCFLYSYKHNGLHFYTIFKIEYFM